MTYKIRVVCDEAGGWHYDYQDQTTLDENINCSVHTAEPTRDFVILREVA